MFAKHGCQSTSELSQELIAHIMTERIVDLFEPVDVKGEDGQFTLLEFGSIDRFLEVGEEETTVR